MSDLCEMTRPYKPKYVTLRVAGMKYENLHARRSALKSRQLKRAIRGRLVGLVRVKLVDEVQTLEHQRSNTQVRLEDLETDHGRTLILPQYGQYYHRLEGRKRKKKNQQKRKARGGKYVALLSPEKRKKGQGG